MMTPKIESRLTERIRANIGQILPRRTSDEAQPHHLTSAQVGAPCTRQLQYAYARTPSDDGRLPGVLETDRAGSREVVLKDHLKVSLMQTGFDLRTRSDNAMPIEYSVLDGRLRGRADGVIVGGSAGFQYPALWQNRCLNGNDWWTLKACGVAAARPLDRVQIMLNQAYLNLQSTPTIFTALNADTNDLHIESVPFDAALAKRMSDRVLQIIAATDAGEPLPREFESAQHLECRRCAWRVRCWRGAS